MMFFLKDRVEALREAVDPDCGVILAHHTKKLGKHQVKEDPFLALSGASALRGFYTSGLIMHRPDEEKTERRLEIELRNGRGTGVETDRQGRRPVGRAGRQPRAAGAAGGRREHDAERARKRDVILQMIAEQAEQGRCSPGQFAEKFENRAGSAASTPSGSGCMCSQRRAM